MVNHKQFAFKKGSDPGLDGELEQAPVYGKVRPGRTAIFWKFGLWWYALPLEKVERIFRRVQGVYGKLCCGRQSYIIEWLVLKLRNGEEVVIHIGDDVEKQAEALLEYLKQEHPEIAYGKE